jgi:hypothetical protein
LYRCANKSELLWDHEVSNEPAKCISDVISIDLWNWWVLPPSHSTCQGDFFQRVLIRCLFGHFHVDFGKLSTKRMARAVYLTPIYAE